MSLFFVDSNCDLDRDYIKKLGVECVDLPYSINDKKFAFDDEFDYKKFYSKCKKGVVISNVSLSTAEYINIFSKCLELGDDIIYVHSSENLVDITNLRKSIADLKELFPERKLELVNSKNISVGQGALSIDLAMMYRRGDNFEDIVNASFDKINEYSFYFASGNCEQMQNRGLVDSSVLPGTMLNIKPIFAVDCDGKIQLVDKVSGKKKSILKLLELCRQQGQNIADYPIAIVYTNDENSAKELGEKIKEYFGNELQLSICQMSPANVGVLGDDILGITFHVHRKIN